MPSPTTNQTFKIERIQNDEEPTVAEGLRSFLFGSYINLMLVFVPLSILSAKLGWGAKYDFIISFLSIIPLAALLGDATEQCALRLGQTVGGLLNATFGSKN